MAYQTFRSPFLHGAVLALLAAFAGNAAALEFQIGQNPLRIENLFTIGGTWRAQDIDPTLIGKSSLFAYQNRGLVPGSTPRDGLCFERVSQTAATYDQGPDINLDNNQYNRGEIFTGCSTSGDPDGAANPAQVAGDANRAFVRAPGSFSPNADDGDLNFEKGDIVHAVAKLTTDVNYSIFDYNFFVRGVAFFDANYSDFTETHYDRTFQPRYSELADGVERIVGIDYDLLDYNIGHVFDIGGKSVAVKLGSQVLNWGESSLLALNSLNTINPPDARRLNIPGLDLKEAFRPIGMLTVGTDLIENISIDTFYTYEWKAIVVDPVTSYFSQSDTLGPGGDYAMLGFGKNPDDRGFATNDPRYPAGKRGYYRPIDTCGNAPSADQPTGCTDTLGALGSTASRTIFRDHAEEEAREPEGGDYGGVLKFFLESVNNGTELALYHANYDSRIPSVSIFAAQDSCIADTGAAAALSLAADCGLQGAGVPADEEVVPVDTARLMVEYPKNIKLYGMSFNTTVGDFALSGEYAFRENLPIQIDTADLTFTALQPAFPAQDVGTLVPGRRSAFPAFLTGYRGYACTNDANCIQPGQYIQGFERFKVGQANLTVLRLIGGDNPIGASQMTMLLEMGMQKVFDMPSLHELQLEGTGSDTHISRGADGTPGIEPNGGALTAGNTGADTLRQNPTAHKDYLGYGTSESYGYRLLNLNRWESALFGRINLETLTIIRHDVKGTTPGIGTNFSDGRKQFNFGIRGDYLSTYIAEVRYTWFTGGGKRDGQRDRDNVFVTFGYQF
jgi:hypothetical protein